MAARPRVLIVSFIGAPGGAHNLWRHFVMDPAIADRFEFHVLAPRAYRDADPAPFADGRVAFHALTELTPPPLRERLLRRMIGGAVPESTRWTTRLESLAPDLVFFILAGMGDINWSHLSFALNRLRRLMDALLPSRVMALFPSLCDSPGSV